MPELELGEELDDMPDVLVVNMVCHPHPITPACSRHGATHTPVACCKRRQLQRCCYASSSSRCGGSGSVELMEELDDLPNVLAIDVV
jgi:hypothetical protein